MRTTRCTLFCVSLAFWVAAARADGEPASDQSSLPASVNLTTASLVLRGEWRWDKLPSGPIYKNFLRRKAGGALVVRLAFSSPLHPTSGEAGAVNAADFMGKLLLRDGHLVTDDDVSMRVQGVFMEGRLAGVAEPKKAVKVAAAAAAGETTQLQQKDAAAQSAALRKEVEAQLQQKKEPDADFEGLGNCRFLLELRPEAAAAAHAGISLGGKESDSEGGRLRGHLSSPACGVRLELTAGPARPEAYYRKAVRYTVLMTGVALGQLALTVRQMESLSSPQAAGLSLLCVGQQALLDAVICLLHLTAGIMIEPLFNAFASAAFLEFCLFGIFELRLLLLAWRARRQRAIDAWTLHRELSALYARFYGALLMSLLLCYHLQSYMHVIFLALHLFWLPQIFHSAKIGCRPPLQPSYVIGTSLLRLVLPFYVFACPANLPHITPSAPMCLSITALVGAQAGVLLLQGARGPRWFVPARLLPPSYDYFRRVQHKGDVETGDTEDCVICMHPMDLDARGQVMVAPCDHRFHRRCLERWMAVKMECPTCRRILPLFP